MDKKAWWAIISLSLVAAVGYFGWHTAGPFVMQKMEVSSNHGLWKAAVATGSIMIAFFGKAYLDEKFIK